MGEWVQKAEGSHGMLYVWLEGRQGAWQQPYILLRILMLSESRVQVHLVPRRDDLSR